MKTSKKDTAKACAKKAGFAIPDGVDVIVTDETAVAKLLPKRKRISHKGDYGKTAIVAGSKRYSGAALLALSACLRSGVGYTALYTPEWVLDRAVWKAPEGLLCPIGDGAELTFDEKVFESLLGYSAVAYGMGLGSGEDVGKGLIWLLERYTGTLLIDADGLNALANMDGERVEKYMREKKCDVILTPHGKECSRLTGKPVEEVVAQPIETAMALAQKWKCVVLLKHAVSIVTDGKKVALNTTGSSGMAKAGSGDVLSGFCAGLCGFGMNAFAAAICAAWLCGKAGQTAAWEYGEYAVTPSDTVKFLGEAFLFVAEETDKQGAKA